MFTIGIVLNLTGLGVFCWLLFSAAVYALPLFVGQTVGFLALHNGAGALGSAMLGLMAGVAMLATAQVIFARVDAPLARLVIALVFALPAGLAGYFAKRGLAALTMSSEIWQQVFAATGAIVVGATAWLRLADAPPHASASTIDHSTARDPGQTVT